MTLLGVGNTLRHLYRAWHRRVGVKLLTALLTVAFSFATISIVHDYYRGYGEMHDDLLVRGRSLARQAALSLPDLVLVQQDWPLLNTIVEDLVRSETVVAYAIVTRKDGRILAAFPNDATPSANDTTLLVEAPILVDRTGQENLGTVQLGISLRPGEFTLRRRTTILLLNTLLGFVLAAGALWFALRRLVLSPIGRLDAAALRLGTGDLDTPVPSLGPSELGRLAGTLDEMRRGLRQSHADLATQNQQLRELDRLKTEFLANMSHEMRTPLTTILGRLDVLDEEDLPPADRRESVAALRRNGEHLFDLVDRLLDLGKMQTGELLLEQMACRPAKIITQACEVFADQAEAKQVTLQVDTAAIAALEIRTDPDRLRQIVRAIVGNATKFTNQGAVRVEAVQLEEPPRLAVTVTDTGVGMPASFVQHAFELFHQRDGSMTRQHGGSGLGLHMTRKLARLLGGDVTLDSEPGRGTRVVITIAAPRVTGDAPHPAPARLAGHVLVVDDARDTQKLLKTILTRLGLTVELADNGRAAIERVEASTHAPFDLVLMDLQMPEVDGVTAIRHLRDKGYTLPIVLLTAHALAGDRERCLAAGATGYETKPISKQRLAEVVARFLRSQPS